MDDVRKENVQNNDANAFRILHGGRTWQYKFEQSSEEGRSRLLLVNSKNSNGEGTVFELPNPFQPVGNKSGQISQLKKVYVYDRTFACESIFGRTAEMKFDSIAQLSTIAWNME
jgi:hypothetical protein